VDNDFQFFLPIEKVDKEKHIVCGYASTPTKDLQGEVVTLDAIKAALPDYMKWANIREMHTNSAVGVAKEASVDSKGLYITAKIVDGDAWKKCQEGVYKGFSIGGSKLSKVGDTVEKLQLREVSLVDRPANPDCRIDVCKVADGWSPSPDVIDDPTESILEKFATRLLAKFQSVFAPLPDPDLMSAADLSELDRKMAEVDFEKREFSAKERKHLASTGAAMADGSFPIANEKDLKNAIQAHGRASDPDKAKAHIVARAKSLKLTHLLPADWPGSTKQEKSEMTPEEMDLQKRHSAVHKAAIAKAKGHLAKAIECHGKACEAVSELHKCFGKSAGSSTEEHGKHLRALAGHLEKMGDHHELAMHSLTKAAGEAGEAPENRDGGKVGDEVAAAVHELAQSHLTEGAVEGSTHRGAGDSPYSAAAIAEMVKTAVTEATKDVSEKLTKLTEENSFMKGQMSVLEKQPSGGPRPRVFSGMEATGLASVLSPDPKAQANEAIKKAYHSIDPNDPDATTQAISKIIGTQAANPRAFGKSFNDPDYHGNVGK
jgi:hypothetical protein